MQQKAQILVWEDLELQKEITQTFVISDEDMVAFGKLSGDYNPLHTDDGFAHQAGFSGCVVYGALLVAKLSNLIGMELPGRNALWTGVTMKFRKPLFIGQQAQLKATIQNLSKATRSMTLGIEIHCESTLIAQGSAEVLLVSS
jgi:acyl dehydratase